MSNWNSPNKLGRVEIAPIESAEMEAHIETVRL